MWLELTCYDQPAGFDGERRTFYFGAGGITGVGPHFRAGAGGASLWADGWEAPITVREDYAKIIAWLGARRLPAEPTPRPVPAADVVRVLRGGAGEVAP